MIHHGTNNRTTTVSRPSCTRCALRKVRCDRQSPCQACLRHNVTCEYEFPIRSSDRPRKRIKQQALLDQLHRYEALLRAQNIDTGAIDLAQEAYQNADVVHVNDRTTEYPEEVCTPQSLTSESLDRVNKLQLIHGQGHSRVVNNGLWTRLQEELDEDGVSQSDSSDRDGSHASSAPIDSQNYLLGHEGGFSGGIRHPTADQVTLLWKIYTERFDPITKILHVPTISPAIENASKNFDSIPRKFEVLMCSIYAAAIVTLSDEECVQIFAESRDTLLSRYIESTKRTLYRAEFMSTTSLTVLQALTIHAISCRFVLEHRFVWAMTGIAIRVARAMGLDRDGEALGLSIFETEIRRRIWYTLQSHDSQMAELCGMEKFSDVQISPQSPKGPTMINDRDLHPTMTKAELVPAKIADSVFIVAKFELLYFAASRIAKFRMQGTDTSHLGLHSRLANADSNKEAFEGLADKLETTYLRYCDPSEPLQLLTMLTLRMAMNVVRFLLHHPRRWPSIMGTPSEERAKVWGMSVKILEQQKMLRTSPQLQDFSWPSKSFLHLPSFIHILDTLLVTPLIEGHERIWEMICDTYVNTCVLAPQLTDRVNLAINNLGLRAYLARDEALAEAGLPSTSTPELIVELWKKRGQISAKKEAQAVRERTNATSNHSATQSADGVTNAGPTSLNIADSTDPFWFLEDFQYPTEKARPVVENGQSYPLLNTDDFEPSWNDIETTWDQWDAWLGGRR